MNLVPVLIKSYFVVRFEGTSPDVEESIRQYYTSSPRAPVAETGPWAKRLNPRLG